MYDQFLRKLLAYLPQQKGTFTKSAESDSKTSHCYVQLVSRFRISLGCLASSKSLCISHTDDGIVCCTSPVTRHGNNNCRHPQQREDSGSASELPLRCCLRCRHNRTPFLWEDDRNCAVDLHKSPFRRRHVNWWRHANSATETERKIYIFINVVKIM